ncbi:Arm DNA-binding domain-containing protein [Bacillus nakamurai]|uniref:Arm DNA-binding domain-containing protein n=1 Tax=Bacillus nakamurai TaxID=1793963 RepID=UPI000B31FFCF|nr:Arm DNA-binding domain-containing protein [Bacillus nakamurai]MED1227619.1 Arm DNA-binding domain-containing protein [Bacillus nakamurai]
MTNIKKNKNTGKYYFVIEAGKYLDSGKRRQIKRSGFRTKKEAKESIVKIISKLEICKSHSD